MENDIQYKENDNRALITDNRKNGNRKLYTEKRETKSDKQNKVNIPRSRADKRLPITENRLSKCDSWKRKAEIRTTENRQPETDKCQPENEQKPTS